MLPVTSSSGAFMSASAVARFDEGDDRALAGNGVYI
jgi:hypothetical protein